MKPDRRQHAHTGSSSFLGTSPNCLLQVLFFFLPWMCVFFVCVLAVWDSSDLCPISYTVLVFELMVVFSTMHKSVLRVLVVVWEVDNQWVQLSVGTISCPLAMSNMVPILNWPLVWEFASRKGHWEQMESRSPPLLGCVTLIASCKNKPVLDLSEKQKTSELYNI